VVLVVVVVGAVVVVVVVVVGAVPVTMGTAGKLSGNVAGVP
jgi:hypothetical protein